MIAIQVEIIEKMKRTGMDTQRADLILTSMNDLMAAYHLHRQKIAAALSQLHAPREVPISDHRHNASAAAVVTVDRLRALQDFNLYYPTQ